MGARLCRIAHLSDLHLGRLAAPGIEQALRKRVNAERPDLIAITGDFVQRAHWWQYRKVTELLSAFTAPVLAIPGNHDLYSWIYRSQMRMWDPRGRYRRMIGRHYPHTWENSRVAVLGVDTTTRWTIQRGRCKAEHVDEIAQYFSARPADTFNVLAVHHPLHPMYIAPDRDIAENASPVVAAAVAAQVKLILCGHWHLSSMEAVIVDGYTMAVSLAGTATSDRYRAPQEKVNAFNVLDLYAQVIEREEWRYSPGAHMFVSIGRDQIPIAG